MAYYTNSNRETKSFWTSLNKIYKDAITKGDDLLKLLAREPYMLHFIKNPTDEQIWAALKYEPKVYKYIKNPTYDMTCFAIQKAPYLIKNIENPSDELIALTLETKPTYIFMVENPTWEMIDIVKDRLIKLYTHPGLTKEQRAYIALIK